jgi:hypothetical protein
MKFLKSKKLWKTVAIIVGLLISYGIGSSGAEVTLEKEKVNYEELIKKIESAKVELKKEQANLDSKKKEVSEALALVNKKESLTLEVQKLEGELKSKKDEVTSLNNDIQSKKTELEKLTNIVKTKKEEPKVFSAGQYIVGKDFPAGRYKAVPVGEGSNFIVFDKNDGTAKVNTILGTFGEPEYVFFCSDGDIMETHAKVKLIPVE